MEIWGSLYQVPKSPGDAALRDIQKQLMRRLIHAQNVFKIINHMELVYEFGMYTVKVFNIKSSFPLKLLSEHR